MNYFEIVSYHRSYENNSKFELKTIFDYVCK